MSRSHIIQTGNDIHTLDSESLQLIIETAEPVDLSTYNCENLIISIEGFLNYAHFTPLITSLSHLKLKSLMWKHGVNNQFSDEDGESLANFIRSQQHLHTLTLSFDQNNAIRSQGLKSILRAIADSSQNLQHLTLLFDDDIQLNITDLKPVLQLKLISLTLTFGQSVCTNQEWHHLSSEIKESHLLSLSLSISPYNRLDKSFSLFIQSLKNHSQIQHLNVFIGSVTAINEVAIHSLSETISGMSNLNTLQLALHDTRSLTQSGFDSLVASFTCRQLKKLQLNLGNNHHIKNYQALYQSIKHIEEVRLKFGQSFRVISSQLFEQSETKVLDIKLQKGSQIQPGSFKQIGELFGKAQKVTIEFADGKDCPDLELIDLIGQVTQTCAIKIFSESKMIRMLNQTLSVSLDSVPQIKLLFNALSLKLQQLQNLKIFIKNTAIEQESIDLMIKQLQTSELKVLSITIKRVNNFQCNQIVDLFAQIVSVKQWAFLSIEIIQKCIMQQYGKSILNQQVNFQIHSGLKLGQQGLEHISRALKAINVTKLRLTILNENQLNEQGIKAVSIALLNSSNLQKITFQILDTNPQVQQYVGKSQATVNQFIKDKSKLQKTYCSLLQRELEKHKEEISAQMLIGISEYLIDDVVLPVVPAGQFHNQQYGFGSSWNPQSIVDIFGQ